MFSNEYEAYEFYKNDEITEFIVRENQYQRLADGTMRKRTFVCEKEGFRRLKDPSQVNRVNRRETRTSCSTMISFTIENGTWMGIFIR